jgi:glutathione synthase
VRLTLLVNRVETVEDTAVTALVAYWAAKRGHAVHLLSLDRLTYFPDGRIGGEAVRAPGRGVRSPLGLVRAIRGARAVHERITTDDMDILWLRYNPSEEVEAERYWGQDAGILFGRLAMERGVLVINDPDTLSFARDKLYFQHFPEAVRPRTLVTRDLEEIRRFRKECGGRVVIKPLGGYGGADVFLVDGDDANLKSMTDAVARSGFIMVQEYLPAAKQGDTRFFLVNGEPLVVDGRYAAIRRVAAPGDFRANMTAGGSAKRATIDDTILELAGIVGPKLRQDGIFFAGLDIIGDRIVEINTISTGGLTSATRLERRDFGRAVVERLERKLELRRHYGTALSNRALATMP